MFDWSSAIVSLISFALALMIGWFRVTDDEPAANRFPVLGGLGVELSRIRPLGWACFVLGLCLQGLSLYIQAQGDAEKDRKFAQLQSVATEGKSRTDDAVTAIGSTHSLLKDAVKTVDGQGKQLENTHAQVLNSVKLMMSLHLSDLSNKILEGDVAQTLGEQEMHIDNAGTSLENIVHLSIANRMDVTNMKSNALVTLRPIKSGADELIKAAEKNPDCDARRLAVVKKCSADVNDAITQLSRADLSLADTTAAVIKSRYAIRAYQTHVRCLATEVHLKRREKYVREMSEVLENLKKLP